MFDFARFYDVGENLVKFGDEASIRSAISRYYYSGLGPVRMYLVEDMGEMEFIDGYMIHKRIKDRLISSNDDTEVSIGEKLQDLKELRNDADYDRNRDSDYFCQHLIDVQRKSKEILEQVSALRNSPPFQI